MGPASAEAQRHCVESMTGLIDELMAQGVVAEADSEALASLIHGSLSETAFWIAEGDQGSRRLERASAALELLLRGLLLRA